MGTYRRESDAIRWRISDLRLYIFGKEREIAEADANIRWLNDAINVAAAEIEELGGDSF